MDLLISMAVAAVIDAVKDPSKKKKVRAAMLKVFRTIGDVYADDEELLAWLKRRFDLS